MKSMKKLIKKLTYQICLCLFGIYRALLSRGNCHSDDEMSYFSQNMTFKIRYRADENVGEHVELCDFT